MVLKQTFRLLDQLPFATKQYLHGTSRDTTRLATATDSELEESDPFADVEEDEDELEENDLYWRTANLLYYVFL